MELVLRNKTERPEGIDAGTARVVGTDQARIVKEASALLLDKRKYRSMANAVNPYGDGKASLRIANCLRYVFGWPQRRPAPFVA